jgi:hypothetical protein
MNFIKMTNTEFRAGGTSPEVVFPFELPTSLEDFFREDPHAIAVIVVYADDMSNSGQRSEIYRNVDR